MADRQSLIDSRLTRLVGGFEEYVAAYDRLVPFNRKQLAAHRECIDLRRQAGSVAAAVGQPAFVASLRRTLRAWGIGGRASSLVSEADFTKALVAALPKMEQLEALRLDAVDPPNDVAGRLWEIMQSLGVVENKAKIVAGTKTLHHLLPDLVVPMDRAWTGTFFRLHPPEWQQPDNQRRAFVRVYEQLAHVARQVGPGQYVTGEGWRTSLSKIIDNALIGFCKLELGDAGKGGSVAVNQIAFEVAGYPPAKNEAKSMISAGHPYLDRVLRLLHAAHRAQAEQGFTPIVGGPVALDVVLKGPPGQAQSDATNYLGGIGDVLEDKSHRGDLTHLGELAGVWLYANDRQIRQVSYRETAAPHPSYTVSLRPADLPGDPRSALAM